MGLFEVIGEWISPGPIGSVSVGRPAPRQRSARLVIAHAGISALALALLLVFVGFPNGVAGTLGCLLYVLAGTFLRPRPDLSNVGWLGGLIDHPFRFSDDINRFLVLLLIVLWPGGVIGTGFLDLVRWLVAASPRAR
jgi:hypothetical protein